MKQLVYNMVNFRDKTTGEYLSFPTLKGDKGDTGKSAYQSAVDLGFIGTEAEWLESLKYVSSPEYDTLLAALEQKAQDAATSAASASVDAQSAKDYYDAISGLKGFEVVVLEEGEYADGVPTIENPKDSTFYFVPSGNGGTNNYNEYIYVNNAWEMVGAKEVDLEPYVLRTELEAYATTESLKDYALASSLDNYATIASLDDYAKKEDLDAYATTTSLEAYATTDSLKDYVKTETLDNYATTAALDDYATTASLESYATKTDLEGYTTTTDLAKDYALKSELVTAEQKAAWNAKYDLPETGIPEESLSTDVRVKLNSFFEADPVDKDLLAAYALKTELLDYQPKTDMKNYATTASLNDYAKSSDLDNYATTASLDDYALKTDLNGYVETATLDNYATTASLSDYVKAEDIDDLVDLSALDNYALKTDLEGLVQEATLEDYALKTELSTAEQRAAWSAKYDKPETGIPLTDLSQDVQDVINDPKIEVDETLTIEGAAADAKVTGDILETKLGPDDVVKFIQWDNAVDGMTMSTTSNMVIMKEDEYERLKVKLPNTFYFIYDDAQEAEAYDL